MIAQLKAKHEVTALQSSLLLRAAIPVIALCLAACSSTKAPKRNEFGPTYRERMSAAEKAMKNSDNSMRSSFEEKIPKGTSEKSFKTSAYTASNASSMKSFSGAGNTHHTSDYAGAGKNNAAATKVTREMEAQNKLASKLFRTPDSRFDTKASVDDKKAFSPRNENFETRDNPAAAREMEKSRKPVVIEQDKPTYSEEDVKRLLNKH